MKKREIQNKAYLEEILRSRGKWFLGGSKTIIWAPQFPRYLDIPGFWDYVLWLDSPLPHLFTVTFLKGGKPVSLEVLRRSWVPSHLTTQYKPREGLKIVEEKAILPDDTLASRFRIMNTSRSPLRLDAVMWGFVEGGDIGPDRLENFNYQKGQFQLTKHIMDKIVLRLTYGLDRMPTSHRVKVTFGECWGETRSMPDSPVTWIDIVPNWEISPFLDEFGKGGFTSRITTHGELENRPGRRIQKKFLLIALHSRINLAPGQEKNFTAMVNIGSDDKCSIVSMRKILSGSDPTKISFDNWQSFLEGVPYFTCSDKFITKYYWYRWYGLKLNTVDYKSRLLPYPCVFEAPFDGWFRRHIVSASMFMRDLRWMHDPAVAKGCLLNFIIANQKKDGSFPVGIPTGTGAVYGTVAPLNWGDAIESVFEVHQDLSFIREIYPAMVRYMEYLMRTRDKEDSGLYDLTHQGETGAEYMSRYLFVDPNADEWIPIRLKAVDATVYAYQLLKALAWMAHLIGRNEDHQKWTKKSSQTAEAVRKRMWDNRLGMFCDALPGTFKRSPYKVSTSFYPFMTDIVRKEHLRSLYEHLFNPKEFWTSYPVPSISIDDPYFSPTAEWKGKMICAWNGPTFLWTNSHIAEALCLTALRLDEGVKPYAIELIKKFIRMLFLDGDINRPTSYEWYNPFTGDPPYFRRVDEYMHCWIIDLIIKYVAGLRIEEDGKIIVDPFDFGLKHFLLDNVICQGHRLKIEWKNSVLRAEVDGKTAHSRKGLGKLCMEI